MPVLHMRGLPRLCAPPGVHWRCLPSPRPLRYHYPLRTLLVTDVTGGIQKEALLRWRLVAIPLEFVDGFERLGKAMIWLHVWIRLVQPLDDDPLPILLRSRRLLL